MSRSLCPVTLEYPRTQLPHIRCDNMPVRKSDPWTSIRRVWRLDEKVCGSEVTSDGPPSSQYHTVKQQHEAKSTNDARSVALLTRPRKMVRTAGVKWRPASWRPRDQSHPLRLRNPHLLFHLKSGLKSSRSRRRGQKGSALMVLLVNWNAPLPRQGIV